MPNNWKKHKLGDVADIQNGYAFGAKEFSDKGIPIIKIKNIVPPYISFDEAQYYNNPIDSKLEKYLITENDVLISMTGSTVNQMSSAVGKIGRYRFNYPALLNQRVGKLYLTRPDLADFNYLYHYISRYDVQYNLALNATGSANQANISPAQIKDIDLELPSLSEQQAIAEILSSLDDKIELNLQTNKTLEEMANALYKHWFVDFGPFQNGKLIESELGLIPEGWEVKKIKDTYDISIGRTPPRKESEWFTLNNEDVKWISIKDMGICGTYIYNTSEYITRDAIKKHNIPVIPTNTVVLSFKLTVGRITITTEDMLSNEAIAHFIPSSSNFLPTEFTYLFLKNFDYNSLGSTSSIATAVNSQTIKNINILYPDKKTISEFKLIVENLFNQIKQNTLETETLKQTRDYLLPKLISGEIRVKDAAKKVKEVL